MAQAGGSPCSFAEYSSLASEVCILYEVRTVFLAYCANLAEPAASSMQAERLDASLCPLPQVSGVDGCRLTDLMGTVVIA
jgi:hypothetical protein